MAYVGTQPVRGQYRKLTNISSSFNGVTTTFTTSVPPGTSDYYVTAGSASQLLVSLGGVIQQPDVDYTVSTNSITFTTAPAAGLSFFGVLMGDTLNSVTPSDGSITTAKLAGNLSVGLTGGSAAAPSLFFTGDSNNGIYSPGADTLAISTNGSQRVTVDSSGRVGIGTGSPGTALQVVGTGRYTSGTESTQIYHNGTVGYIETVGNSTTALGFANGGTEKARLTASGQLLVGTSSATNNTRLNELVAVVSTGQNNIGGIAVTSYSGAVSVDAPSILDLQRSRGTTDGSLTAVVSGDSLGTILFRGSNGSAFANAASIQGQVDTGTVSGSSMPGRLVFSTTADGASSPTERMRITNAGAVTIGPSTTTFNSPGVTFNPETAGQAWFVRDNAYVMYVNRLTSDGDLIQFAQASTIEGTISVSGTTVSYNGAHLSRWSQLPSGAERTEILRGSVLSNIDEMCEWGDENNEQLNRMKVSDIEGDKNVSGVFQAWDDDDDTYTNDFYCAMTGDFIIRIAEGVTVERGDLLMSAGDGTAKPQDDDIIRSKTIAKVTSTNVSCTYEDGSYCVPCVLMAC